MTSPAIQLNKASDNKTVQKIAIFYTQSAIDIEKRWPGTVEVYTADVNEISAGDAAVPEFHASKNRFRKFRGE